MRALRARWPDARIVLCVAPAGEPVARLLPGADEVVPLAGGLLRAGAALGRPRPDLALVPDLSLAARLLALRAGARQRVGPARRDRGAPLLLRALSAARRADAPSEDRSLFLAQPPAAAPPSETPLVSLVPGAGPPTARWGVEKYALVASALAARGATLAVLGQPGDAPLAARLQELAGVNVADLTALAPGARLAALASSSLVVGGDVPLVHCGRALGRPTVVMFGPTDPVPHVFGPAALPIRLGIECQPCAEAPPPRCPLGHLRCLNALAALPVAEASAALLDAPAARRYGPA